MSKLIIVEGCDGSGKTTYVNNLVEQLPDETIVKHCGPLRRPALQEYLYPLTRRDPDAPFVADRWHLGEMIYGPLYRGSSQLTMAQNAYIEMYLEAQGALRVIMDTPYDTVKRRLAIRGEDFLQEEHTRLVLDFYEEHLRVNAGRWVSGREITPWVASSWPCIGVGSNQYVGSSAPEVLFVIETVRQTVDNGLPVKLPAIPEKGSEGEFFMNALLRSRLDIHTVGLMRYGDKIPPMVAHVKPKVVVVSGKNHPTRARVTVNDYAKGLRDAARS